MKFRPCIDLHGGQVKQIVGSTLRDHGEEENFGTITGGQQRDLATNFATDRPAQEYAELYKRDCLTGGHVIMLGPGNEHAAREALLAYPNGLQIGGGINLNNAKMWLEAGASHVIVTSFVFRDGQVDMDRLRQLVELVGKERLVLDLSCRKKQGSEDDLYYVVTDRWQRYTDVLVNRETLTLLGAYCDEFLVHGVENEGKRCGILEDLVVLLGDCSPIPVTYAGGVKDMEDLERVKELGKGRVDVTVGSALDCFGGSLSYETVVKWHKKQNPTRPPDQSRRRLYPIANLNSE
jgi:phosphoribosylformimino-5-aminoimidazole carboxamide ribotide isomerase